MNIFPKFPEISRCPICGTNKSTHTVLVPIDDSKNDGNNIQAVPTHLSCIVSNIRYSKVHQLMGLETDKGHEA
jgi:hypothetical protein